MTSTNTNTVLSIEIKEARNLATKDKSGLKSPYCKIKTSFNKVKQPILYYIVLFSVVYFFLPPHTHTLPLTHPPLFIFLLSPILLHWLSWTFPSAKSYSPSLNSPLANFESKNLSFSHKPRWMIPLLPIKGM